MDPSIAKLLEDDEDEAMHSTADVEAFTAALNRDIDGGGDADGPKCSAAEALSQSSNCASKPSSAQFQTSGQDEKLPNQTKMEVKMNFQSEEQKLSCKIGRVKEASGDESQAQQLNCHSENDHPQLQEEKPSTSLWCQKEVNGQEAPDSSRENNSMKQKQSGLAIPIPKLLPLIRCKVPEDKAMEFDSAYSKLLNNEISNNDFIRIMVNIVGNQVLTSALRQFQMQHHCESSKDLQTTASQRSLQTQVSSQKHTPSSHHQYVTAPKPFPQLPMTLSEDQKNRRLYPKQHHGSTTTSQTHTFLQLPMTLSEDQKNQKLYPEQHHGSTTTSQTDADASFPTIGNSAEKSQQAMAKSDLNGMHSIQRPSSNADALNRENQNSVVSSQSTDKKQISTQLEQSFPIVDGAPGGSNVHARSSISVAAPKPLNSQIKEPMLRKGSIHPDRFSAHIGVTPTAKVVNATNETKRLHGGSDSESAGWLTLLKYPYVGQALANGLQKEPKSICPSSVGMKQIGQNAETQNNPQFSAHALSSSLSTTSHIQGHVTAQPGQMHSQMSFGTPPTSTTPAAITLKRPVSQRQSCEAIDASSSQPSKKQKTTGAPVDQSIDELNDITAVSGVNLRDEEEQLLSTPKYEGRASEATRKVVQEEEERLLLQKEPLKKKLANIISKCGIATVGKDVERCLSMCVEERLRGLLPRLIRLSKQRVDIEKSRHQFVVTSDVRRQILMMNQEAKEDWEKKQAEEAAKLLKLDEAEGNTGTNASKNKDDGRSKASKANKEVDDKMRTTAANVAARAAVGGDDMLSKWQLMAEQARQKRERSSEATGNKRSANFGRTAPGQSTLSVPLSAGTRKYESVMPHPKIIRSISIKDVIAVLEREPQMSRSNLIYRLYERIHNS